MSQTNSDGKTVTERIDNVGQLSVGDKIVFERRSLDDDQIESKRALTVVDGATRTVANDHHDPQAGCVAFETQQHAVEVRGEWAGAKTYCLADEINLLDGTLSGIVEYDSGVRVEVARVKRAETEQTPSGVSA